MQLLEIICDVTLIYQKNLPEILSPGKKEKVPFPPTKIFIVSSDKIIIPVDYQQSQINLGEKK
jgi:hypothetical protein